MRRRRVGERVAAVESITEGEKRGERHRNCDEDPRKMKAGVRILR
jgi:hypothetical protein